MDLLWSIKTFDWFESYSDDKKYWKEGQDKLSVILDKIKTEKSSSVLLECLKEVPVKTGNRVRQEIHSRMKELEPRPKF